MVIPKIYGKAWCIGVIKRAQILWGIEFRADNWLDGKTSHLMVNWNSPYDEIRRPRLFNTRQLAREWNRRENGYIKLRPDLQCEPHGWKMPRVVKVEVTYKVIINNEN